MGKKQILMAVVMLICSCYTTAKASEKYVEIRTPSMIEFLKNWYGIEPNEKGLYCIDSLQRVYHYKVTELPLPSEFIYLKNISHILVRLDMCNDSTDYILDLSIFPRHFNKYLEIISLSKIKRIIIGEEPNSLVSTKNGRI